MDEGSGSVEEKEESQAEALFALLESAVKSTETPSKVQAREAYQKRLRTFSPTTYFAKPATISPLVCARFGWTNPSQDIIVCSKCKAVVAISFHPQLTAKDEARIAALYQEKLCTAHQVTCLFHSNAFPKTSSQSPTTTTAVVVPSYLGSVLPPELVELVDQSNPHGLLQRRMKRLMDSVGQDKIPPLPLELPTGRRLEDVFPREGQSADAFVSNLTRVLGCTEEQDEPWAAVLALFCWEPMKHPQSSAHYHSNHDSQDKVIVLHCPTCLAQRGLRFRDENDTETDDSSADEQPRPAKRQRSCQEQLNPVTSHRHYCPVICGFPSRGSTTVPLWQTIAANLFRSAEKETRRGEETSGMTGQEVMMKIHRLLQSGLR